MPNLAVVYQEVKFIAFLKQAKNMVVDTAKAEVGRKLQLKKLLRKFSLLC